MTGPSNLKEALPNSIELIAMTAHEANAAYCRSIGDFSQPAWFAAPEWQKQSARNGVLFHQSNVLAGADASHAAWYDEKLKQGWSYGPEKDPENKRHPCMVPYKDLPIEQQIKDHIFRSVVHGMAACAAVFE